MWIPKLPSWWNKELHFLQFTDTLAWRLFVWIVTLTILAYCASHFIVG